MDQSLIHKIRKQGERILSILRCNQCRVLLDLNEIYSVPPDLENRFDSRQNPMDLFCENCKNLTGNTKLQLSKGHLKIIEFFQVFCTTHPKNEAYNYFASTFQPFCSECNYPKGIESLRIEYKRLEKEFFLLYKQGEKLLCKDRKKALVSYNTSELLKACAWLRQLGSGPICKAHPWNFSTCIDFHLNTYCSLCENPVAYKFYFTDVQKVVEVMVEAGKAKARNSSFGTLNSFMIKTVWISFRPYSRKDWEVNLIFLETLDLLADKAFEVIRCVNCLKSINCGSKQGIQLDCGHIFCFKCVFCPDNDKCPIDYIPAKYSKYLEGYQVALNECHALHYLGDTKAFKLPCFHYSCQEHLGLGCCLICGFEFGLWPSAPKESMRNRRLDEFVMIRCLAHNLKVSCFQVFPLGFYCEKCLNIENSVPVNGNLNMVYSLFDSLYSVVFEKMLEKDLKVKNLNFWRLGTYLKLVCNQKKFVFLGIIETYFNHCRIHPTQKMLFFNEFLPSIRSTSKNLKIPKKSEISVKITPNEDFVLSSLFIANQYFLLPEYSFPAVINFVTIKKYSKQDNIQDRKPMKLLTYYEECLEANKEEHYKEFFLSYSVFFSESFWYEISIEINPGEYFFGKPYSRTSNKEFRLEFVNEKEVENNIGKFGGPFVGIGVFQLSSL